MLIEEQSTKILNYKCLTLIKELQFQNSEFLFGPLANLLEKKNKKLNIQTINIHTVKPEMNMNQDLAN